MLLDRLVGAVAVVLGAALLWAAADRLRAPVVPVLPSEAQGVVAALAAPGARAVREPAPPVRIAVRLMPAHVAGHTAIARPRSRTASALAHAPAVLVSIVFRPHAKALPPVRRFAATRVARPAQRLPEAAQRVAVMPAAVRPATVRPASSAPLHRAASAAVNPNATPEPPIGYDPQPALISQVDVPAPPTPAAGASDLPELAAPKHRR